MTASTHPYQALPDRHFWRRFVSDSTWRELPFMDAPKFTLHPEHRLATAGSCFAQHITRHMKRVGLQPHVAEPAHPYLLGGDRELLDSYEQFSARYGNVYTARQGLELLRQAAGTMAPVLDIVEDGGRWYDLLRPGIPKQGFASRAEAEADRLWHLQCVRRMFEAIDVFVFTLGLTEAWQHAEGGHTYPVCPGTVRGRWQPELHRFHNFSHAEVVADLEAMIAEARVLNPRLRFVFTVSPVPLVATRSSDNVLVASAYSKAVLRAAVGEVAQRHDTVQYFPSFEIIGQTASFGQYLASDLREVTDRGVGHVMTCFLNAFYPVLRQAAERPLVAPSVPAPATGAPAPVACRDADAAPVECEEVFNDRRA